MDFSNALLMEQHSVAAGEGFWQFCGRTGCALRVIFASIRAVVRNQLALPTHTAQQ